MKANNLQIENRVVWRRLVFLSQKWKKENGIGYGFLHHILKLKNMDVNN